MHTWFLNVRVWLGGGEWCTPTQAAACVAPRSTRGYRDARNTIPFVLGNLQYWSCLGRNPPICLVSAIPHCLKTVGNMWRTWHGWLIRAACRANWRYRLMTHLSYSASTLRHSLCKAGLAFKEKTLRQTWYQMQNEANTNICIIDVMHTLPCWDLQTSWNSSNMIGSCLLKRRVWDVLSGKNRTLYHFYLPLYTLLYYLVFLFSPDNSHVLGP